MNEPLPPGWTETIVTFDEFQSEVGTGKYSSRVPQSDIFMIMFQRLGVRMNGHTLAIADSFEIMQDRNLGRIIVRQGPA